MSAERMVHSPSSAPIGGAYEIARSGDVNKLRELLLADPRAASETDAKGRTPLHAAAERGNLQCLHLLLEVGAETDARDDEGWTPLQLAVPRGNLQAVELLLLRGADARSIAVVVHMAAVVVRSSSPDEPRSKLVRNDRVVDVSALLLAHGATCWIGHDALPAPQLVSSCSRLVQSLSMEAVAEAQARVSDALASACGDDPHARLRSLLLDRRSRGALAAAASSSPLPTPGRRRFVSVETFARARAIREAAELAEEDGGRRCIKVLEKLQRLRRERGPAAAASECASALPHAVSTSAAEGPSASSAPVDGASSRRCSTVNGTEAAGRQAPQRADIPWDQLMMQAAEQCGGDPGAEDDDGWRDPAWEILAPAIAEAVAQRAGPARPATEEEKLAYAAAVCVGRWAHLKVIKAQAVRAEAAAAAAVSAEQERAAGALERLRDEHARRTEALAAGPQAGAPPHGTRKALAAEAMLKLPSNDRITRHTTIESVFPPPQRPAGGGYFTRGQKAAAASSSL